ncbi:MAG: phosphoadenosine phosphosulfate reductase family protein, partial [Gemmataceae bacterium]|nr:phosphoadenosine phosphosulfate reductase family protein [Gemmataceae bacterium]
GGHAGLPRPAGDARTGTDPVTRPACPFRIAGPALISFSGGRTSGYLLKRILDAHGGRLPADVIACFANTGKEMPQTLDFVRDCGAWWGVPVVWLEFDPGGGSMRRFRVVTHATASRRGEPFAALIGKKNYLPNPVTRFCTSELKIRPMRDYARSLGWEHWTNVLGLRHDEPRRVARSRQNRDRWDNATPLFDARVTKAEVGAFWAAQPFDLGLPSVGGSTPAGNCDLCFLKAAGTLSGLIRQDPGRADWWIAAEEGVRASRPLGARFRKDRPGYRAMRDAVLAQAELGFGEADALTECFCHD